MQTDTINLWANCSSGFMLMLFFCPVKLGMLLHLGLGWPVPLQGLNNFRICLQSYLWCLKSCIHSRQPGHSMSGQCPGRWKARSQACSALSLKPEQDYWLNFLKSIFSRPTGHLFVYFGEMSVLVFCLFFCWVVFWLLLGSMSYLYIFWILSPCWSHC